jgi:hypothetical protein
MILPPLVFPDICKAFLRTHTHTHTRRKRERHTGEYDKSGNTKAGSITVQLTSCLTGLALTPMATDNFLQNRLIQTSQTGGQ